MQHMATSNDVTRGVYVDSSNEAYETCDAALAGRINSKSTLPHHCNVTRGGNYSAPRSSFCGSQGTKQQGEQDP